MVERKGDLHHVALLIGGNEGNRLRLIEMARSLLQRHVGTIEKISAVYETEPWGFQSEQTFLNQALLLCTTLEPHALLKSCQTVETELGRQRHPEIEGYSSRTMDVDIIFYDQQIIDDDLLQVPHPRMHLRRFVLQPLSEIMPQYIHPVLGKTVATLLSEVDDIDPLRVVHFTTASK